VARADGKGLERGPIVAWLKRRDSACAMMIGGRHFGVGQGPTARVSIRIDGREIESWAVTPSDAFFLRFLSLPAGALAGDGAYAKLEIGATGRRHWSADRDCRHRPVRRAGPGNGDDRLRHGLATRPSTTRRLA